MKNLLVPTDLTVQSLLPVHQAIIAMNGEKCRIMLVHSLWLPTSISDLLSLQRPHKAIPQAFSEAFELIKNRYAHQLTHFQVHFIYCQTSRYLNNYIQANTIDAVYSLADYRYQQPFSSSVQFNSLLRNCCVPVHTSAQMEGYSVYQIVTGKVSATLQQQPATEEAPAFTH